MSPTDAGLVAALVVLLGVVFGPIVTQRLKPPKVNGALALMEKRYELQQKQVDTINSTLATIGVALTGQAFNYREDMKEIRQAHQQTSEALRIILDRMERRDRKEYGT